MKSLFFFVCLLSLTGCSTILREVDRGAHHDAPSASKAAGEELNLAVSTQKRKTSHNEYVIIKIDLQARDGKLPSDLYFHYARISLGGFGSALIDIMPDGKGGVRLRGDEGFKISLEGSKVSSGTVHLEVEVGSRRFNPKTVDVTLLLSTKKHKEFALTRRAVPVN